MAIISLFRSNFPPFQYTEAFCESGLPLPEKDGPECLWIEYWPVGHYDMRNTAALECFGGFMERTRRTFLEEILAASALVGLTSSSDAARAHAQSPIPEDGGCFLCFAAFD